MTVTIVEWNSATPEQRIIWAHSGVTVDIKPLLAEIDAPRKDQAR